MFSYFCLRTIIHLRFDHQDLNLGSVLLKRYFILTEATNTRLKSDNTKKEEIRLFSSSLFEVASDLRKVLNFCTSDRHGSFNEFGKDTHILKCVNCNHRFFEVETVAGTGYEEGGRILNAR
jgi:hypothetical protein